MATPPVSSRGTPSGTRTGVPPPSRHWGWRVLHRDEIAWTRNGVLLLFAGALLSWIPVLDLIGSLLLLIGAVLVVLGRRPFGPAHSRNASGAVALLLGVVAATVVLIAWFVPTAARLLNAGNALGFISTFQGYVIGLGAVAVLTGLASVLLTYSLQTATGRVLLWTAYGTSIALTAYVLWTMFDFLAKLVEVAYAMGTLDSGWLARLQSRLAGFGLLDVLPSVLFAAAFYMAWKRIDDGIIPASPQQAGAADAEPP